MRPGAGIPFGHFVLKRRLARGGMAEVFLAAQRGPEGFDRRVAVKRILPHLVESDQFVRMFHDEARLAARLTHPNVVHIYEFGRVDEHYFIAMEYVEGVHAGSLIKYGAHDPLPPSMIARIGADACAGLHYAHQARDDSGRQLEIVHRDISPPNLMLTYDGVVKLVDFGIAKAVSQVEQTRPGVVKGKYAYMSPEQTVNHKLDGRSDVFSLCLVLWELVAGRVALDRDDPVEAMRRIRDGRIPSLERARPDVPPALAAAIAAGLEVQRDDRPTAAELGVMLEGYIKASPELGTALQLAEWIQQRFPRPAHGTGEEVAIAGPGPGTQATSATPRTAATQATAQGTQATQTTQATGAHMHDELDDDMTAIVARPLEPTSMGPARTLTGSAALATRHGRTGRIAVAAGITALVGAIVMVVAFGGAAEESRAAPTAVPIVMPDAQMAIAEVPPDARLALAPPDAGIDAGPAYAVLEIITDPPGATVYVGEDMPPATSPVVLEDLAPGELVARIEHEGYEPKTQAVTLAARQRGVINVTLKRLPEPTPPPRKIVKRRPPNGYVTARTTPYSTVYRGNEKLGVTPFARVPLPAGRHTLTFKNPSRAPYRKTVTIKSGQTLKLNFPLP
ncbi:MAG TPA: serine/threonine-protein kinase [Kofleriaceae bacterium]|nr:serine/threonine-protein kinase [Kofleriaceae bacterium]